MIQVKLPNGLWTYDPGQPLGAPGGFGAVFVGAGADGKRVAIKRLHLNATEAAHRELRIASELAGRDFRHVMPIFDAGQDAESNGYFVVMPVAACSLQDRLNTDGPLTDAECVAVLKQIATGLGELRQLVHRDLKPANVLELNGSWRIADFGIARFVEESTSARTLKDCLSPLFAAPEQWRYEHATAATDIYALGCVAHSLLSGSPPFAGQVADLQDKHLHDTPRDLVGHSPRIRSLVSMMLRKEPAARPSLDRVIQILDQYVDEPEVVGGKGLNGIALAAASHEQMLATAEADRERKKSAQGRRDALAAESKQQLRMIFDVLADRISASAPNVSVSRRNTSIYVQVGQGTLELDLGSAGPALAESAFPRSGWDVVCGAVVGVAQTTPKCERSANLWYTRLNSSTSEYRWYEAAYGGNPLTGRSFGFEPAAVSTELADAAHWVGMDVVQASYGPYPIDDEDVEGFYERWTHLFAEACSGRLNRVARSLPRQGPY